MRFVGLIGAAIAAAALTSCSGPSRPEPLTRRELIRQVNSICRRANDRIGPVPILDPLDTAETATAFTRVVREQRTAYRRLVPLVAPEGDTTDFERWRTQVDLALDLAERSVDAIESENLQAAIRANQRAESIRRDADRFAVEYGFTACAQPTG